MALLFASHLYNGLHGLAFTISQLVHIIIPDDCWICLLSMPMLEGTSGQHCHASLSYTTSQCAFPNSRSVLNNEIARVYAHDTHTMEGFEIYALNKEQSLTISAYGTYGSGYYPANYSMTVEDPITHLYPRMYS